MRSPSQHSVSNLNIAKDDDFDSDSSSNTDTTTDNVARNYKSAVIRRQRSTTIETAQRSTRALQPQSSLARRVLTERRFGQDGALHAVEAISDGASKLVHYLRLGETARGALSDAGLSHAGTSINPQTRDTVHADAKVKCIPVSNSVDAKNRLSQLSLATDNLCREAPHGNDISKPLKHGDVAGESAPKEDVLGQPEYPRVRLESDLWGLEVDLAPAFDQREAPYPSIDRTKFSPGHLRLNTAGTSLELSGFQPGGVPSDSIADAISAPGIVAAQTTAQLTSGERQWDTSLVMGEHQRSTAPSTLPVNRTQSTEPLPTWKRHL